MSRSSAAQYASDVQGMVGLIVLAAVGAVLALAAVVAWWLS